MENSITTILNASTSNRSLDRAAGINEDWNWRALYTIGGMSALVVLLMIPAQVVLYIIYPPPDTVGGFFAMMQENALVGLISLDLFYMLTIVLMGLVVLAVCVALRRTNQSLVAIALFIALVSTAMYFASCVAFDMLQLSNQYAVATDEARRAMFLAAGEGMLATYKGTAYNVSYVLAAVSGLILAVVMLRSNVFDRKTAYTGIVMNVMGLIPATAGTIGLVFAFASLIPTVVWLALVARRLYQLGDEGAVDHQ